MKILIEFELPSKKSKNHIYRENIDFLFKEIFKMPRYIRKKQFLFLKADCIAHRRKI